MSRTAIPLTFTALMIRNRGRETMKAVALAAMTSVPLNSAAAVEITSRETLNAYLEEKLVDGTMLSLKWRIGDTFKAQKSGTGCLDPRTLDKRDALSVGLRILVREKLVTFKVIDDKAKMPSPLGGLFAQAYGSAGCEFQITGFDYAALTALGADKITRDGKDGIKIPLARQDYLGAEVDTLDGGLSMGRTQCDIAFIPYFRNYEQSAFVNAFRSDFEQDYRFKNVFNDEASTKRWCFRRKYDGSYDWKIWSRY